MTRDARHKELAAMDGITLRFALKKMGLDQNTLALKLDVTKSAISMGMNGSSDVHRRTDMRERIIKFMVDYEQGNLSKTKRTKLRAA